jgi:ribonuclease R
VSPIDRHTLLRAFQAYTGPPLTARALAATLGIPREQQAAVRRTLRALAAEGAVSVLRGPRYLPAARTADVSGRFVGSASGTGAVLCEPSGPEVTIPAHDRGGAVHGDRVRVALTPGPPGGAVRGRVVDVTERRSAAVVGRLWRDRRGLAHVQPFDPRLDSPIRVIAGEGLGAKDGEMVTVEVSRWAGPGGGAAGRVVEVLGAPDAPGVDTNVVLRKYDIPDEYSPDAVAEARAKDTAVGPRDLAGRKDFRGDLVVTIDGDSARDFDDAVSVSTRPDGLFRLAVHIADVAHYVPEGGALDLEAFERGTSVYFPERAVHMFPHELATGVCSLLPRVDRLVQSCVMDVNAAGEVVHHELHDGVIHSRARLTYAAVDAMLAQRDPALLERHADLVPALERMRTLFEILNARRRRRGAIDFDLPEAEVVLDSEGAVADIVASDRTIAHRLIEEFMLLANETVAAHLERADMPALYRIHEAPDAMRVADFEAFLDAFGLSLDHGERALHPRDFQHLIDRIRDTPEERPIAALMLRTMQKARYDATNLGHFGLAAHTYTHFTSPIRRYPDLVVHRLLRELGCGRVSQERRAELEEALPEVAQHASATERRAQEAEREVLQWKKARFMARRIGEAFDGVVTGVAPFGLFVQISEPFVEGLVPLATMADDDYRFDAARRVLFGASRRRVFCVGSAVHVVVARVDLDRRQIELSLTGAPGGEDAATGGRSRSKRRGPSSRRRLGKKERAASRGGDRRRR